MWQYTTVIVMVEIFWLKRCEILHTIFSNNHGTWRKQKWPHLYSVVRICSPHHLFPPSAKTAKTPTSLCISFSFCISVKASPEAEFLHVIGTKVLKLFLLTIHSHFTPLPPPSPSKRGLKLVCNVNIVYGNLKSENSQDYAQKPQRNCTSMNLASILH